MDLISQNPALGLFAVIAPLLIAFVKQAGWSRQINAMIAFACYVVIGVAGALTSGAELSVDNLVPFITSVTVVGSVAYNLIWSNIGGDVSIDDRITATTSIIK